MKRILLIITLITPMFSNAETLWSDFSASLLKGENYEVGDNSRTVFTFEHAAGYNWGDSFLFVDRLHSANGKKETYAEFSPRFKLTSFENSVVDSMYVASTAEVGNGFTNYLLGIGTKLKLPNFIFFNANFYHKNIDRGDNAFQTTLSWAVPAGPLMYDGFVDYVTSTDDAHAQMNFTSQLKYNVGPHLNSQSKIYIGVEYVFWQNKFGIDGINERNVNLLVKYHF